MQVLNTLEIDQVAGGTNREAMQSHVTETLKGIGQRSDLTPEQKLQALQEVMQGVLRQPCQNNVATVPAAT